MTIPYGEAIAEGYDLTAEAIQALPYGEAVATGYPLVNVPPPLTPPSPTVALDAVHVKLYDANDDLLLDLDPYVTDASWREEENGPGVGQFTIRADQVAAGDFAGPTAAGNYAILSIGTDERFRVDLAGTPSYSVGPDGAALLTVQGPGAAAVLDNGQVEPEYGFRREAGTERFFNYGARVSSGHWFIASHWVRPVGRAVKKTIRWLRKIKGKAAHQPAGWGTRPGNWIWLTDPDKPGPAGSKWFTSTFTMPADGRAYILACLDDSGEVMLDGDVIGSQGTNDWQDGPLKVKINLTAGTHTIAAKVTNAQANTPAGLLLVVGLLNNSGEVTDWRRTTTPNFWWVTRTGGEPAWLLPDIVWTLISEGAATGFEGYDQITRSFSELKDTDGRAWPNRQTLSLSIGDTGLTWLSTLAERGFDWHMSPRRRLDLWVKRGRDLSGHLTIALPANESATTPDQRRVNRISARSRTGWVLYEDGDSIALIGRRGATVDLGGDLTTDATAATVKRLAASLSTPARSFTLGLDPAVGGPLPYRDFDIGDVLYGKVASDLSPIKIRCTGFDVALATSADRRPLFNATFTEVI